MCSAPPPAGSGTVPPVESKCMRTRTSATVAALPNRTMCSTWNPTAPSSSRHWYVPCSCGPGGLRQRKLTLPPSLPPLSLSLSLSLCLSGLVCACMWCACVFVCIAARRRLEMPKLRSELLRVENRMFQVWYEGASGYGWQEAGAAFVYTDGAHPIGNGCLSWSQPGGPCSPAGALSLVQDPRTATPAKPSVGLY